MNMNVYNSTYTNDNKYRKILQWKKQYIPSIRLFGYYLKQKPKPKKRGKFNNRKEQQFPNPINEKKKKKIIVTTTATIEKDNKNKPKNYLIPTSSPYVYTVDGMDVSNVDILKESTMTKEIYNSKYHEIKAITRKLFASGTYTGYYHHPREFHFELPKENIVEIAILGRSNVGKSTLIARLLQSTNTKKDLVRTSKKPGCTTSVNYYSMQPVDFLSSSLAGYGGKTQLYNPENNDEEQNRFREKSFSETSRSINHNFSELIETDDPDLDPNFEWTKEFQENIRKHLQKQVKRNKEMREFENQLLKLQEDKNYTDDDVIDMMKANNEDLSIANNVSHHSYDNSNDYAYESLSRQLKKEKEKSNQQHLDLSKLLGERKNLFYLVDLPGYGFAKASTSTKDEWMKTAGEFIDTRDSSILRRVFILIDARRGLMKIDQEVMKLLDSIGVIYQIVLTKKDAISNKDLSTVLRDLSAEITKKYRCCYPVIHVTSSKDNEGIEELRNHLVGISLGV